MILPEHFHSLKRTGYKLTVKLDDAELVCSEEIHVRPLAQTDDASRIFDETISGALLGAAERFHNLNGRPAREARIGWIKTRRSTQRVRKGEVFATALAYEDEDGMVDLFEVELPDGIDYEDLQHKELMTNMHCMMRDEGRRLLDYPHMVFALYRGDGSAETYTQESGDWTRNDHHYLLRFLLLRAAALEATALVTGVVGTHKITREDGFMIACETRNRHYHAIVGVGSDDLIGAIESSDVKRHLPFLFDVLDPIPAVWDHLPGGRLYADHLLTDCTEDLVGVRRIKTLNELPAHLQVLGSADRISWPTLRPVLRTTH